MIKEVHIFKAGKQTSAQGITREFTVGDLKQIADSYEPDIHEAPIRIGHEDNDKVPAWGWVKGVKVKGSELFAEIDFSPMAEEYIKNGLYKKVSASFYSPDSKINPEPGKWSLRHVALLGAQPPAVKGLKGFAYEENTDGVLDFAVALTPDQVFDEELGPTLKRDLGPLEILKEKLDEARTQMIEEEARKEQERLQAEQAQTIEAEAMTAAPETQFGEGKMSHMGMMAKTKKKPMMGGKQGHEGDDDEEDEDSMMAAEMADKDLPDPIKKMAAKKMAKARGISEDEAMGEKDSEDMASCGTDSDCQSKHGGDGGPGPYKEDSEDMMSCDSKKKKKMNYEESDSEEHGETEVETADGEGPVASKVKKNARSGAADPQVEEDEEKYDEPTFEAGKKKRGTDHLNASDIGAKETEGGPGGLVRTRSTSKGINLGYEEVDEDELEDDDEQHVETDNNKYVSKTTEPKRGKDGLKGRKTQDPYNDQSGRGELGKAGVEGETDRGMKGTGKEEDRFAKGSDGGEMEKNYEDATTGKSSAQDADRTKTGKGKEIVGYPDKYMTLGAQQGGGKQVKSGKVRVMEINHSESDPLAAMMARLEELEAANSRLREQAEYAERQTNRMRLEQFTEGLYDAGKLTEAIVSQESLVDYLEGLEYGTLEFAEGETAASPLMAILENLPAQVCYSEVAGGDVAVREEDLDPHQRALKISKEEGVDYTEALKQVLFSA